MDIYGEGQHPCVRGEHCAGRKTVLDEGKTVVVPAPTYTAYCMADRARLVGCITDLPGRYTQLGERIGDVGQGQAQGVRVSGGGSSGSRPPINLGVEAFQTQIAEILISWEERTRFAASLSPVDGNRRPSTAVKTACVILAGHI